MSFNYAHLHLDKNVRWMPDLGVQAVIQKYIHKLGSFAYCKMLFSCSSQQEMCTWNVSMVFIYSWHVSDGRPAPLGRREIARRERRRDCAVSMHAFYITYKPVCCMEECIIKIVQVNLYDISCNVVLVYSISIVGFMQ